MRIKRRDFLRGAAGASGAALLGGATRALGVGLGRDQTGPASLPPPEDSGIDHIVVVMMENRSFDHFLGWLPNADGKQAGLTYTDNAGVSHATHSLSGDYSGCPHPDPDHSYGGARVAYDHGLMDGFLRASSND